MRRLLSWLLALGALWLILLLVVGEFGSRWLERRARTQLGQTYGAEVRLGGIDLDLVRGRFRLVRLEVKRTKLGSLRLEVDEAEIRSAPLGLAALRRDHVDSLSLRGVELELSSWAVLAPPPGRELSLRVDRFSLREVDVRLAPTLLLPGAGAVTLRIDEASGGAVDLRSAASWILALRSLDAKAELPGGAQVKVSFRAAADGGGSLTLGSPLLGGDLTIPLTLPARSAIQRAEDETKALAELVAQVAREITKRKAVQTLERLVR